MFNLSSWFGLGVFDGLFYFFLGWFDMIDLSFWKQEPTHVFGAILFLFFRKFWELVVGLPETENPEIFRFRIGYQFWIKNIFGLGSVSPKTEPILPKGSQSNYAFFIWDSWLNCFAYVVESEMVFLMLLLAWIHNNCIMWGNAGTHCITQKRVKEDEQVYCRGRFILEIKSWTLTATRNFI